MIITRKKLTVVLFCLIFSAIVGLFFRLQTLLDFSSGIIPIVMHEDPWYTVRQIEQMVHNYPSYAWFDPMLNYPDGKTIQWGPFFPFLGATLALVFGATTQGDIIRIASWVPPLLFLVMIPICFLIGKKIWNLRVGVLSAILVSVVNGEFLYRSMYGNLDHHIAETVLSFAFILGYLYILQFLKNKNYSEKSTYLYLLSLFCGVVFYMGYMNIPTIMLVALTIPIFFVVYAFLEEDVSSVSKLFLANAIIFGTFILLYLLSGVPYHGLDIQGYNYGIIAASIAIILFSLFVSVLKQHFVIQSGKAKPKFFIISCVLAVLIIILGYYFGIIHSFYHSFIRFFFASFSSTGIDELSPISLMRAVLSYNVAIAFSIIGFFIVVYAIIRNKNRILIYFFIWATLLSIVSISQVRYQYYEGPIVCILMAICLDQIYLKLSEQLDKKKKVNNSSLNSKNIALIFVILIVVVYYILSLSIGLYVLPTFYGKSIKSEWVDTTLWLNNSTPAPSLDYYAIYEHDLFQYPSNTHTILSWWDYGHYILTIGNRLPLATPLQDRGAHIAASFFLTTNETKANQVISPFHARYIVTNYDLSQIYNTVSLWAGQKFSYESYIHNFIRKNYDNVAQLKGLRDPFFLSMFTRMHYFDGSFMKASEGHEISYADIPSDGVNISYIVHDLDPSTLDLNTAFIKKEIISFNYTRSTVDVPALTSYRLIYESPKVVSNLTDFEIHPVKVFEHVKGHTIPGTGTIELPLVTNQGRNFTYRQQSVNNTFTLPYSTTNSPYDVHATGPYRIIETNETFEVDESQIEKYYI